MSLHALADHPFAAPRSLAEACALLAERAARGERTVLLAGGTDWFVEQHLAPAPPVDAPLPLVADVSRLAELRGVADRGDAIRIGAGTTFLELRRDPLVTARLPLLSAAARDVGAIQIQARGTLAGNLATGSPAADGVAALAALDAVLELASVRGKRRVPIAGFYTGYRRNVLLPDELIAAVEVVPPAPGSPFAWRKVGTRQAQAISKVALAAVAETGREADADSRLTRLGLGMASVAPTVVSLPEVRALGLGRPLASIDDEALAAATLAGISPIDDVRSTAAYRRHVAVALVRRFFESLRAPS